MAVGAYLNPSGMGCADFNAAKTLWETWTGRTLTVTRKYKAASSFGFGTDADLQQMINAKVKICITLRPAYNPVSATDLANMTTFLASLKASGADADVTLWHEPYYSGLTGAQYIAMVNYYGPAVRSYFPLVFCASASAVDSHADGGFYPGDAAVDKIAVDLYAYSNLPSHGSTDFTNIAAIADGASPPKSLGVWEFNGSTDPVNGQTQTEVSNYFAYVQNFFATRAASGSPNGDLILFNSGNGNWLGNNSNKQCGFEGGITPWVASGGCSIAASGAQAYSGTGSMAVTSTGTANMSARSVLAANYAQAMPVTPGGDPVSTFAFFRAATIARNCQATIEFYTSAGVLVSTSGGLPAADSTSAWTQVSQNNVTVPATSAYAVARIQVNSPAAAGEVHYADDVAIFTDGPSPNQVTCIGFSWDYRLALWNQLYDALPATAQITPSAELPFADAVPTYDDLALYNLVRIGYPGASSQQIAQDIPSQQQFLPHVYDRQDLLLTGDADALGFAQYVLLISKDPALQFETITIDPLADPVNLYPQVLGRRIGDRITITRRPPGAGPPITRDCYIRGIKHDITDSTWLTTWVLQDATKFPIFILNHLSLGRLGSGRLGY